MHKRGISPLIATVLLVAFTIAIAVLVFLFLRGQVEDLTAKFGQNEFNAQEETSIDFTVPNCELTDRNQVKLKINNEGSIMLDCFWIVPKNGEAIYYTWNIKSGQEDERELAIGSTPIDNKIDIYPCLIRDGKIKTGKNSVTVTCS